MQQLGRSPLAPTPRASWPPTLLLLQLDLFKRGSAASMHHHAGQVSLTLESGDSGNYAGGGGPASIQCGGAGGADMEAGEVHIQYSTDQSEYVAMLASLHSALRNSAAPGRLRFHLTIPGAANARELCAQLLAGLERWVGTRTRTAA